MASTNWTNASFHRFERSIESSTGVAEIVLLVEGEKLNAYLKPIGNRAGPHVLACEWVGSQLAKWFGLSTLDFGLMQIEDDDEIPLGGGYNAEPGPAFVSKKEPGAQWSGLGRSLEALLNPEDIARLVIFDTWILNEDRCTPLGTSRKQRYDNVFLSDRDGILGKHRLLAMDHTHCFTNGRDVTSKVGTIGRIKDKRLYGLFPQFEPFLTARRVKGAVEKIRSISSTLIGEILASVPPEWGVNRNSRKALGDLILQRARFLADEGYEMAAPFFRMHNGELSWDGGKENGGK